MLPHVQKQRLANGLTVNLIDVPSAPFLALDLSYHVGSKDDPSHRKGLAHYYEHMMFEGSANHGINFISSIEHLGGRVNGGTSRDRTQYWCIIPPAYLEKILEIEADRLAFPEFNSQAFEQQRQVIISERLEKYDNRPLGTVQEEIHRAIFPRTHPYHAPVIGWMDAIEATSLEDLRDFTRTQYHIDNAFLTVAGPLGRSPYLIEKTLGQVPGRSTKAEVHYDLSVSNGIHASLEIKDKIHTPKLYLTWHSTPLKSSEDAAFDLLAELLTKQPDGILQKVLVQETRTALDVKASQISRELAGLFQIEVTLAPNRTPLAASKIVLDSLAAFSLARLGTDELRCAAGRLQLNSMHPLSRIGGFGGMTDAVNLLACCGHDSLTKYSQRFRTVTADHVHSALAILMQSEPHLLVVHPGERAKILAPQSKPHWNPLERDRGPTQQASEHALPQFKLPAYKYTNHTPRLTGLEIGHSGPLATCNLLFSLSNIESLNRSQGLGRFVECLLEGRLGQDQLSTDLKAIQADGGEISASLYKDMTDFGLIAPTDSLEPLSTYFVRHLQSIELNDRALESLVEDFRARLSFMKANDDFLCEQTIKYAFLPDGHPALAMRFPDEETFARVKPNLLRQITDEILSQSALTCVTIGGSIPDAVTETFGGGERLPVPKRREEDEGLRSIWGLGDEGVVFFSEQRSAGQAKIRIALKLPGRRSPMFTGVELLADILAGGFDSILARALRQDGLATYGIRQNLNSLPDVSFLVVNLAVAETDAHKALSLLTDTLIKFREAGVEGRDLERSKRAYLSQHYLGFETPQGVLRKARRVISEGRSFEDLSTSFEAMLAADCVALREVMAMLPANLTAFVSGSKALKAHLRGFRLATVAFDESFVPVVVPG